ncbi:hypothetical protein AUK45_00045 [Candidatus Peregrinibacteria bacterium CG2_30_44_17]|nr:MAG: hypothetical protein AUK45_00045 [Candidatus Peregrinibacteria bacterium CG2_30_44_17]
MAILKPIEYTKSIFKILQPLLTTLSNSSIKHFWLINSTPMSVSTIKETVLGGPIRRTLANIAGACLAILLSMPAQARPRSDRGVEQETKQMIEKQDKLREKRAELASRYRLDFAENAVYKPGAEYVLNNVHPALLANYIDEDAVVPVGTDNTNEMLGEDVLYRMIAKQLEGYGQDIGVKDSTILKYLRTFQTNNRDALGEQLGIFSETLEEAQTELEKEQKKYMDAFDAEFSRLIAVQRDQNTEILRSRGAETAVSTRTGTIGSAAATATQCENMRDEIGNLLDMINEDNVPTQEEATATFTTEEGFSPEMVDAAANIGRVITMLGKIRELRDALQSTEDESELAALSDQATTEWPEPQWGRKTVSAAINAPTAKLRLLHVGEMLKTLSLQEEVASHEYLRKVQLFDEETGEPILTTDGSPTYKQAIDKDGDPKVDAIGDPIHEWEPYAEGELLKGIHQMRREKMSPTRQQELLTEKTAAYKTRSEEIASEMRTRLSPAERTALQRESEDIGMAQYMISQYSGLLYREMGAGIYNGDTGERNRATSTTSSADTTAGLIGDRVDMDTVRVTAPAPTVYNRYDDIFIKYDGTDPLSAMGKYPLVLALGQHAGRIMLSETSEEVLSWSGKEGEKGPEKRINPLLGDDIFDRGKNMAVASFDDDVVIVPTDLAGTLLLTEDTSLVRAPEGTAGLIGYVYGTSGLRMETDAEKIAAMSFNTAIDHLAVDMGMGNGFWNRKHGLGAEIACSDISLQQVIGERRTTDTQMPWIDSSVLSHPTVRDVTRATCAQIDTALQTSPIDCASVDLNSRNVNALLFPIEGGERGKGDAQIDGDGQEGLPQSRENTVWVNGVGNVITTLAGLSVAGPYDGTFLWDDQNSERRAGKRKKKD